MMYYSVAKITTPFSAKMLEWMLFCCEVYLVILCHEILFIGIIKLIQLHLENFVGMEIE